MKHELTTLRLWNPLFPHIYLRNEWGDVENDSVDLTAGEILEYEDKILDLIERERLSDEGERGLAVYLDDDLNRKVHSINPSVEEWNGELWGVTEVKTYGDLSASELSELTDWLTGQFSDGWGEGLEQREIRVDDGELCVSFWDSSDRFFIKPEDELKNSQSSGFGMTMGGMN
ncbi:hypothetical protein [Enterocloster clostridioformis]|uniref:hypothetical protein n=1 Tax=Enterocloster clostridioformis TaxID=1531 RepID=UPI0032C15780